MATLRVKFGADVTDAISGFQRVEKAGRQTQSVLTQAEQSHRREVARLNREGLDDFRRYMQSKQRLEKSAAQESKALANDLKKFNEAVDREGARVFDQAQRDKTASDKREIANRKREAARALSDERRAQASHHQQNMRLAREATDDVHRYYASKQSQINRMRESHQAQFDMRAEQSRRYNDRLRGRFATAGRFALAAGGLGLVGAGLAARVGRDIASGLGAETDYTQHMRSNVSLETKAANLANQAYIEGAPGSAGTRQSAEGLELTARSIAKKTAFDQNDVLEALTKFVDKTGDLETGRDILGDMAKLSRATGANLIDMVDAAADVSLNLGDMKDKGAVVGDIMTQVAAMGKVGAVEIKDLAFYMSKVAANSSVFEGSMQKNIVEMAALAELARARGGAASAAEAATGIQSFANQFGKNPRIKGFEKLGIDVRSQTKPGTFRDPIEIMRELMVATGGDPIKMNAAIADERAKRVSRAFGAIYRQGAQTARENLSGTGLSSQEIDLLATAEGLKAFDREIARLTEATMSRAQLEESFSRSMNTTASKVQVFNTQMSEAVKQIQVGLTPALQELTPFIVKMAQGAGEFFGGHGKAITQAEITANNALGPAKQMYEADEEGNLILDKAGKPIPKRDKAKAAAFLEARKADYMANGADEATAQEMAEADLAKNPAEVLAPGAAQGRSDVAGKASTETLKDVREAYARQKAVVDEERENIADMAAGDEVPGHKEGWGVLKTIGGIPGLGVNYDYNKATNSFSLPKGNEDIFGINSARLEKFNRDQAELKKIETSLHAAESQQAGIEKWNTMFEPLIDGNALRTTSADAKPVPIKPPPQPNNSATTPPDADEHDHEDEGVSR